MYRYRVDVVYVKHVQKIRTRHTYRIRHLNIYSPLTFRPDQSSACLTIRRQIMVIVGQRPAAMRPMLS